MQNNGVGGIFLNNNASAELTNVEVKDSGGIGIAVFNNSTAVLKGHVSSTGSGVLSVVQMVSPSRAGRRWKFGGRRCSRATMVGGGVDIVDSQVVIFGYPESQGSILTAEHNTADGIFVVTGSLIVFKPNDDQRVQQWQQRDHDRDRWRRRESWWGREVHDREQPHRLECWRRGQRPDHRRLNGAEQSDRPVRGWCRDLDPPSRTRRIRRASNIILALTSTSSSAPGRPSMASPSALLPAMRRSSAGAPPCVHRG